MNNTSTQTAKQLKTVPFVIKTNDILKEIEELSKYNEGTETDNSELEETNIIPFPVPNDKCFHGLGGDFVRLVHPHTEADAMALLVQFLAYYGNLISRNAYFQIEGDKHFTNLFCVVVGNTASGRKGTSFGRVKQVFKGEDETHEKNCIVSGLASGEGLLYQIRDAIDKTRKKDGKLEIFNEDAGVSDKRLLVVEGEFAQVLRVQGREGNTLSSFLRNLWDNGTARCLTKNSPLRTTDAHVSIIGHITKTELLSCLDEVDSANGYANRFLFVCSKRSKFLPLGSEIDEMDLGELQADISRSVQFSQNVSRLIFTTDARILWQSVYERLETSRTGFLAKITQRASPYVLRLACIYTLLDQKDEIDRKYLESALAVWQYCEDSARYIFGERTGDKLADGILTALRESGKQGLTKTEISHRFQNNVSASKIDSSLQSLLEMNLISFRKEKTNGKPKTIWIAYEFNEFNELN